MHHIGIDFVQTREQALSSGFTVEARLAVQPSLQHIRLHLKVGGKTHFVLVLGVSPATPEGEGVLTDSKKLSVFLHHNATG